MPFETVMGPNRHIMENNGDLQPIARSINPTLWVPSENLSFVLLPNLCYQYTDDLIVINNKKLDHYLDLTFIKDTRGKLSARLYDKRDDLDFYSVNLPFLSSSIPSGPSYSVHKSKLIRYA